MNIVQGDLIKLALEGRFEVIVHGCNCLCRMGRGVAKDIRATFPEAYAVDQDTAQGDRSKLGSYTSVKVERNSTSITILNPYTQYSHTGDGVLVDYAAVKNVFDRIKHEYSGLRIGYPKIGAGLARGDWNTIVGIIAHALSGEDHTLVEYQG